MFRIKLKELRSALICLTRFALNKLYIPAVVIEADSGSQLYMKASSQDMGYVKVQVETEEAVTRNFKAIIPYNLFNSAIAKLAYIDADMVVSVNITENNLTIKTDNTEIKIVTLPAENILDIAEPSDFDFYFEIPRDVFVKTIDEILSTLRWNNTTPHLDGIIIERVNRRLCFQAVSPYKISYRWFKTEEDSNTDIMMTIPRKTAIGIIDILEKYKDDNTATVAKSSTNNMAVIRCGKVTMGIRLMQNPSITATKVLERMSGNGRKTVEINGKEFLDAVIIGSITATTTPKIKISIDASDNTMTIQSENRPNDTGSPITGSSKCVIGCRVISMPERFNVKFNPELIKGRVFDREEVIKLHFVGQNNNILITGKGYIEMIAPCL